jgi:hypothetical protein
VHFKAAMKVGQNAQVLSIFPSLISSSSRLYPPYLPLHPLHPHRMSTSAFVFTFDGFSLDSAIVSASGYARAGRKGN